MLVRIAIYLSYYYLNIFAENYGKIYKKTKLFSKQNYSARVHQKPAFALASASAGELVKLAKNMQIRILTQ